MAKETGNRAILRTVVRKGLLGGGEGVSYMISRRTLQVEGTADAETL